MPSDFAVPARAKAFVALWVHHYAVKQPERRAFYDRLDGLVGWGRHWAVARLWVVNCEGPEATEENVRDSVLADISEAACSVGIPEHHFNAVVFVGDVSVTCLRPPSREIWEKKKAREQTSGATVP